MKAFIYLCILLTFQFLSAKAIAYELPGSDSLKNQQNTKVTQEPEPPATVAWRPYQKHLTIGASVGYWQQAKSTEEGLDPLTLVDIADYHLKIGVQVEYNFTEALSVFLDVNGIIIPREENIQHISLGITDGITVGATGKGGIIVPCGLGMRYTWAGNAFRPFVASSLGATYFYIGGGNVSVGLFDLEVLDIEQQITEQKKLILQGKFGGGFDYRFSPMFSFRVSADYWLSNRLNPPVGSINAFQGWSISGGLAYIVGKQ
ncbi:MAG: hypothetical protein RIG62_00625 [Cyclobacteriaceae bacterium]